MCDHTGCSELHGDALPWAGLATLRKGALHFPMSPYEKRADAQIGQAIRKRREDLGITQAQLGKAMFVTFQQVQKYERGQNRVAASKLLLAAEVLKCSIGELYGKPSTEQLPGSERLLRAWSRLDGRQRESVTAMLESLGA